MFGLFKKKPKKTTINVTATLNVKLMPVPRGEVFGDPMDAWLRENDLGTLEGEGCGLTENNEIDFCDLEFELYEVTPEILDKVASKLESLGAPKGSRLRWDDQTKPIGKLEGLAIYLNGTDLAEEVYANSDVNQLADNIQKSITGKGFIGSSWNGRTETALYLYGPSFDDLQASIAEVLASHPLCEKCRVVQIAPRPEGDEI